MHQFNTVENRVLAEQIRLLFSHSRLSLLALLIICPIMSLLAIGEFEASGVIAWTIIMLAIIALRYFLTQRFFDNKLSQTIHIEKWLRLYLSLILLTGAGLGIGAVHGYAIDTDAWQLLVLAMLTGLSGGALATMSSIPFAYLSFVVPLLGPLIVYLLVDGERVALVTSAFGMLFGVVTIIISRQFSAYMRESIEIRFRKDVLLKEIEDKEKYLNAIMQAAEEAIVTTDSAGVVETVNEATVRLFGYASREVVGRNIEMLMPPEYQQKHEQNMLNHTASGALIPVGRVLKTRGKHKNGHVFPIEVRLSETSIGERKVFTGIIRDLTELTQTLVELRLAKQQVDLANAQLAAKNAELAHLSMHDSLTGIENRRAFDMFFEREWKRAKRSNKEISVILIDVDHFKAYNDFYGHKKGDECLRAVSDAIKEKLWRPGDLFARYGGEEFVIVLTDTNLEGASVVTQRLFDVIESANIQHERSPVAPYVTLSAGIASIKPADTEQTADSFFASADQALYAAKQAGRNCYKNAKVV